MLNYQPLHDQTPPPPAAPAIALCLPGLVCWIGFFALRIFQESISDPLREVVARLAAPAFYLAVITAVRHCLRFDRRRGQEHPAPDRWFRTRCRAGGVDRAFEEKGPIRAVKKFHRPME